MTEHDFNQQLLAFLDASPTPFHATQKMLEQFLAAGYQSLDERDTWSLQSGGRYVVTRNASSLVAFTLPSDPVVTGFRLMGAHTDSPCLKIKTQPEQVTKGYLRLGVETYGGVLLSTWFDRDLSIAGRVSYQSTAGEIKHQLINFKRPVGVIPNLAIHLNREVNNGVAINAQTQLPVMVMQLGEGEKGSFNEILLQQLQTEGVSDAEQILEHDCILFDTQKAAVVGLQNDFITSARLDNLLSCFIGMQSMLSGGDAVASVLVCNDHEEVGSLSASGAQGPLLKSILKRVAQTEERYQQMIAASMMISCDNAHGIHPNHAALHDDNHAPLLNAGPVIKLNANQRYASNSETSAWFKWVCQQASVPVQSFIMRSDLACGSTIGPITSAELGVRTVDVGVPQFAMHSIRELAGTKDAYHLMKALVYFLQIERI
ncbi:aspartyl aminopeptidase [Oceanospirillum multiglobuliferum]|uniref:M18 family aminopeptidase n=1 Tax=Oceanospirillum multiglobuliferum TaxID=64969 RepID=A0A1T4LDB7_9GAMM|nr:M18 family aminopeptidase [Oceanospirillum multiglobuliferum]OPX56699.1 M18 family aminopeptidase [Oceanospirillum multiglobuliferum]SJZ52670.1 aspartyl aminopeptidase [Oceanospirillum multiglobuliferum]